MRQKRHVGGFSNGLNSLVQSNENSSLTIPRHNRRMTFEPQSFAAEAEVAIPQDVRDVLRCFAKSAREACRADSYYPQRNRLLAALTDARACIDRINTPAD